MMGVTIAEVDGVPIPEIESILQSANVYPVPAPTATTAVTAPPDTVAVNVPAEPSPRSVCVEYVPLV